MKILVVEDEVKLAQSLKKGLENKGFAVDMVYNGQEAMDTIEISHDDYDLVILDFMLPDKNGIEICRSARSQGLTIPIIMLTAKDSVSDRVMGLDSGADDYLIKPFDFEELVARVKTLLRRPSQVCLTKFQSGNLTLDPTSQKVFLSGKEVKLTPKEFALLEYFMRNTGMVLTREMILSHIWDQSFDSFSNVIDVHIAGLKKKLRQKSDEKYIETVRGSGYRFKK